MGIVFPNSMTTFAWDSQYVCKKDINDTRSTLLDYIRKRGYGWRFMPAEDLNHFQLIDITWQDSGEMELIDLDGAQTWVHVIPPKYPDEKTILACEYLTRIHIPSPARMLWLFDRLG